jgi:hypothetical protein
MPLWGQFLDRRGEVRESVARTFLWRLERQTSLDGLDRCFPLQVLSVVWLSIYATAIGAIGGVLRAPGVRRAAGAVAGAVLIGLGVRLATESR